MVASATRDQPKGMRSGGMGRHATPGRWTPVWACCWMATMKGGLSHSSPRCLGVYVSTKDLTQWVL